MEIKKLLRTSDHPFVSQQVSGAAIEYEDSEAEAVAQRILDALISPDPTHGIRRMLEAACIVLMDAIRAEEPGHGRIFRDTDVLKRVWPEGSQPFYAQRIVEEARPLCDLLEKGNADPWKVANLALSLGALKRESELSAELAKPARSGLGSKVGGIKGAGETHKDKPELHRRYVESYDAFRASGMKKTEAYEAARKRHKVSWRTIYEAVRRNNMKVAPTFK